MYSSPLKAAEALVAAFTPSACREEVLGDLHERYRSPGQYGFDALRTVPLVIISRIRRTADPQVLLIQAFALYLSFLGAAWFTDREKLLREQWGLLRLAIPAAAAMLGLILEDAYASPGRRSPLKLVRGPAVGLGLALVLQGVFWAGDPDLAVPLWIALYGCIMSLLLCSAVRLLFPPVADQLQGANAASALWLKQARESGGTAKGITLVLKGIAATLLLLTLIAYQLWKRG